jgi:hypothetical protein
MAVILARQVTATLQRTRLGVKVSCQALHAVRSALRLGLLARTR